MRRRFDNLALLIVVVCLWCFSSCKKDATSGNNTQQVLAAYIFADTSLSLFTQIIQRSNEISLLARTDSITILAPTNTAFLNAGITAAAISAIPSSKLDLIARYYFIPGKVRFSTGSYIPLKTLLNWPVYGYGNNDSIYFNGIKGSKTTIPGSNTILYKLNAPLELPADSINQLPVTDSSFSFFVAALHRAGIVDSVLTGWNTLLAPDNNAFIIAGYPDTAFINHTDSANLRNIIQYHILPGQYFSSHFLNTTSVVSATGASILTNYNNGVLQFTGAGNSGLATVLRGNIVTGDSTLVYKINELLLQ
jgi:uncharacterized surface protein with fasciclin (FAS1) repeats